MSRDQTGQTLGLGQRVDHVRHFRGRAGGVITAIRPHSDVLPVQVKWPVTGYEWHAPEQLRRSSSSGSES